MRMVQVEKHSVGLRRAWLSIAARSHWFQGRLFAPRLWPKPACPSSPRESQMGRIQASRLPDASALARESLVRAKDARVQEPGGEAARPVCRRKSRF